MNSGASDLRLLQAIAGGEHGGAEAFFVRLTLALARAGVETIDLLPELRDGGEELFWKKDEHLNVAGHERLARILFERM